MAFDFEKWALSFYGVVDERFAVETDLFQLHIHRDSIIKKLVAKRSEGILDIYIPLDWNMEQYQYQEKLRRLLRAEVMWQAKIIFTQRTMYYAKRYGIPCERVEVGTRSIYYGICYYDMKMIRYNPWVICCATQRYINNLVCHELAHFYEHNHSQAFWDIVESLYLGLELTASTNGNTIQHIRKEFSFNMFIVLRYWGQESYLKVFYSDGLVEHKKPLIKSSSEVEDITAIITNFVIKF